MSPARKTPAHPRTAGKATRERTSSGRRRAAWGTISRDQIVEAAVTAVRAGGYEQMTIRSLAAELGVAPMTLYRHVRDKDDLLDAVVDRLLARAWRPRADPADWQAWVAEAADRLRDFLVSQPAALHVYLRHPVVSPAAMERYREMLRVLRHSGADERGVLSAYATIHTHTIGFAALEASRARWASKEPVAHDEISAQLAEFITPRQFAEGVRYLLEGIKRRAKA
jgi:AcrR family transcriptional regulator